MHIAYLVISILLAAMVVFSGLGKIRRETRLDASQEAGRQFSAYPD